MSHLIPSLRSNYAQITCSGCQPDSFLSDRLCLPCPPGATSPIDSTSCACPPGQYWRGRRCLLCPPNTYSGRGATECTQCPMGLLPSYVPGSDICTCRAGGFWNGRECEGCPEHHFSFSGARQCSPCPSNSTSIANSNECVCPAGTSWKEDDCVDCPENTYSPRGAQTCMPCPLNSSSPPGAELCACDPGFHMRLTSYVNSLATSYACYECWEGQYSPKQGSYECLICPHGSNSSRAAAFCLCGPGQFFNLTSAACEECAQNTFSKGGVVECEPCLAGAHAPPGSDHCNCTGGLILRDGKCEACPNNYYSYPGDISCTACPDGLNSTSPQGYCECPRGQHWDFTTSRCKKCKNYYFMRDTNATECHKCPPNSVSWSGEHKCYCKQGHASIVTNGTLVCRKCPENHYAEWSMSECKKCAKFTMSKPGSASCYR